MNFTMLFLHYHGEGNLVLLYTDTVFFIYSRTRKTTTIVVDSRDLPEKYNIYDFCKMKRYLELSFRDNENVFAEPRD